jgi:hypothetical protein
VRALTRERGWWMRGAAVGFGILRQHHLRLVMAFSYLVLASLSSCCALVLLFSPFCCVCSPAHGLLCVYVTRAQDAARAAPVGLAAGHQYLWHVRRACGDYRLHGTELFAARRTPFSMLTPPYCAFMRSVVGPTRGARRCAVLDGVWNRSTCAFRYSTLSL